jgi:hypothetical protein
MLWAIQAELYFPTATRRDNVLGIIQTALQNRPERYGVTTLLVNDSPETPPNGLVLAARFINQADADAQWLDLTTLSGPRSPDPGSTAARHDCTHDVPNGGPCVVTATFAW